MTDQTPETALHLLHRHGLPEDVIDGVLTLHAQELAALQRAHVAAHGLLYTGTTGEVIDLIDPTVLGDTKAAGQNHFAEMRNMVPVVSSPAAAPTRPDDEPQFGVEGCTCRPFTRQETLPRYLDQPGDTVDMISGWAIGNDCPHHAPATPDDGPSRRAGLRDQLRRAVCEVEGFTWDSDMLEPDEYGEHADTVLAVLHREWPWLRAEAEAEDDPLTAQEARDLADDLGTDLYRAQDALAFVAECCDIADREQRQVTTAQVREWLKGARCGRQLAAQPGKLTIDPAAPPLEFVTYTAEPEPAVPSDSTRHEWIDGHPLMEAIATAVHEHCETGDGGIVHDDPRNIAAAAWAVVDAEQAELRAEAQQLTDASRRLLEQRQEMAEERYAWQERGDRAEARVAVLERQAAETCATVLREAAAAAMSGDVQFNTNAIDAVAKNAGPFALIAYAQLAVGEHLRRLADATQQPAACVHPDGYDGECPCPPSCTGCHVAGAQETAWLNAAVAAGVLHRAANCGAGAPQPDTEPQAYPHQDGDVIVLGPEVFASTDGLTISWKGDNYIRQQADTGTEAHPPTTTWKTETPLRGDWRHTGATYDDHAWAAERYQDAIENDPDREWRLVRATTTYTVDAEHEPGAEIPEAAPREPHPTEADVAHAMAVLARFQGQHDPVEPAGGPDQPTTNTPTSLCGSTRSLDGATYPSCARGAGHEEAYCRSADGDAYFLAAPDQPAT